VLPVLSIKGRPEVRLGGFRSVAGGPLAGPWAAPLPVPATPVAVPVPVIPAAVSVPATPAAVAAPVPADGDVPAATNDAELDELLAKLEDAGATAARVAAEDPDLDPELAALLKEL
jgi:hypothetical protein